MHTSPQTATTELLRAAVDDVGVHSGNHMRDQVHRGLMLRVRRGVYLQAERWLDAPLWRRHAIVAAAEAMSSDQLFCRETALLIHQLPVLHVPDAVFVRTAGRGRAATQPAAPLTGQLTGSQFLRQRQHGGLSAEGVRGSALLNIPKKYVEHALPAGFSRAEFRGCVDRGECTIPEVHRPSDSLPGICGVVGGYRVEPAGLAVVDTVSRLPFADAVVVLDAVKARGDIDVEPWLAYLRTKRQRLRWQRAWDFADPRAESPLESESRAVLHELGFPLPTLQRVIHTRFGTFRLDMCWEKERVVGEIDGRSKYVDPQYTGGQDAYAIHYAEKQRREAVEEDGWQVARWGKAQIRRPEQLVRRLRRCGLVPR